MKICVISYHSCPFSLLGQDGVGGMSVYLKELSRSLTQRFEIKIDIFTRVQNPDIKGIRPFSSKLRVIHLEGGPPKKIDRKDLDQYLPEFMERLQKFMIQEKPEHNLVYSHYWLSGIAGEKIKADFKIPLIHKYHTIGFLKEKASSSQENGQRLEVEKKLSGISDLIISSSEQEKFHLVREYGIEPSKVSVIHPGVNKHMFFQSKGQSLFMEAGIDPGSFVLLYVGRIEPVKNLMILVELLEKLKVREEEIYDCFQIVVIGGGRKEKDFEKNSEILNLQTEIKRRGFIDKISFLGSRRQEDLKQYYSNADALIVPSLYESFGLVALEALACGCPVIGSRVGEMTSLIKEKKNGISFNPDDTESLMKSVKFIYYHRGRMWDARQLRERVIRQYSWERTASRTQEIFLELSRRSGF